jgi:hypothetical protein
MRVHHELSIHRELRAFAPTVKARNSSLAYHAFSRAASPN